MTTRGTRRYLAVAGALCFGAVLVNAQIPAQHQEHHPTPPVPARGRQAMPSQPAPPKALYPSLIELPRLTPERRADLDRFASERMVAGTKLMSEGLQKLNDAARSKDYAGMQAATDQIREGLAQFDSGLGARRALVEGRAPRDVALEWFKQEMNLPPAAVAAPMVVAYTLRWYHYAGMGALGLFALVMIWMHFHRMRRAEALLTALTSGVRVPTPRPASAERPQAGAAASPANADDRKDPR